MYSGPAFKFEKGVLYAPNVKLKLIALIFLVSICSLHFRIQLINVISLLGGAGGSHAMLLI